MNALAFIQASVDEQIERERHGPNHICRRCRAARAIARAERGDEPWMQDVDWNDPAVVDQLVIAKADIQEERERIDRCAAAWSVLEVLLGGIS